MKKIMMLVVSTLTLSACVSNEPPICYAEAQVNREVYQIPIFKAQDVTDREYLAGAPFYGWTNKGQFTSLGNCPKF